MHGSKRPAGQSQIQVYSQVTCAGCAGERRLDTASVVLAAAALHNQGWRYREVKGRWGWHCNTCCAALDAVAAQQLRTLAFPGIGGRP